MRTRAQLSLPQRTWGTAKYSRVLELAGRDAQIWIAKFLEEALRDKSAGAASEWIKANSPIHVPLKPGD